MNYIKFKKRILENIGADLLLLEVDWLQDMEADISTIVGDGQTFIVVSANSMTTDIIANLFTGVNFEVNSTLQMTSDIIISTLTQNRVEVNYQGILDTTIDANLGQGLTIGDIDTQMSTLSEITVTVGSSNFRTITMTIDLTTNVTSIIGTGVERTISFSGSMDSTIDIITTSSYVYMLIASTLAMITTIDAELGSGVFVNINNNGSIVVTIDTELGTGVGFSLDGNMTLSSNITAYTARYALLSDYETNTLADLETSTLEELYWITT